MQIALGAINRYCTVISNYNGLNLFACRDINLYTRFYTVNGDYMHVNTGISGIVKLESGQKLYGSLFSEYAETFTILGGNYVLSLIKLCDI